MNWSRIKSIFIVVFLCLNSFLGYQLWQMYQNKIELAQLYEGSLDELLLLKNISLDVELHVEQGELAQLNVQFLPYTVSDLAQLQGQNIMMKEHVLLARLTKAYPLPSPWNEQDLFQQFIGKQVMRGEQYVFDGQVDGGLVYLQEINQHPIFGGILYLLVNERQEITGYQQVYYHVINQASEQPVISSFASVRTLLDNQAIPEGATIRETTLGYYGQLYAAESQVLTPAWRVGIDLEGKRLEYFVNAYTGAIESLPAREQER